MKQKNNKETEKAWIESILLWKKRNLLAISSPKDSKEKEFALDLQKIFQKKLRYYLKNQSEQGFDLPIQKMQDLAHQEELLMPEDFRELYRITFDIEEEPQIIQQEEDVATVRIINKQRKFAENTKEIHQRKDWSPV